MTQTRLNNLLVLAGCGGSSSSGGGNLEFTGAGSPGTDNANTRHVAKSPIDRASAPNLKVAWTLPLTGESTYGAVSSTPIVSNGVIYLQDLASNVQAISLADGSVLW